jgi:hypothetical protein
MPATISWTPKTIAAASRVMPGQWFDIVVELPEDHPPLMPAGIP